MDNPFEKLEERRVKRDAERSAINKRLADLSREADQDQTALQVLRELYPDMAPAPVPSWRARLLAAKPTGIPQRPALKVKDMVLTILRENYPTGLSAKQIKAKAFLKFKSNINSNTLTVSLVRFSKDNLVKIEGREWFFIPPQIVEQKENPGCEPGLLLQ